MSTPAAKVKEPVFYFPPVIQARGGGEYFAKAGAPLMWLSSAQLAREFGNDRDTICRWRKDGLIPKEYVRAKGRRSKEYRADVIPYLREKFAKERE